MRTAFRALVRRPARSGLTVAGIAIGIFALVLLGALAEQVNALVGNSSAFFNGRVLITAQGADIRMPTPLTQTSVEEVAAVEGVAFALANVSVPLSAEAQFGPPQLIHGVNPLELRARASFPDTFRSAPGSFEHVAAGRALTVEEADSSQALVVLGSSLAQSLDAQLGTEVSLRQERYLVVGVLAPALTSDDDTAFVPQLRAAQLVRAGLPPSIGALLPPGQLATSITAIPTDASTDLDALAERVSASVPGVRAYGPARFQELIGSASSVLNAILFGVAAIALVVGSLSVINTMIMAVSERTREIGIKRAMGAQRSRVLAEFLTEAALIGFLGGLVGASLGSLTVLVVAAFISDSGTVLFMLTPRLLFGSVLGALVLALLAGLYPARRAARLDPIFALRGE